MDVNEICKYDLHFLCGLIEYIGRQTKNERAVIVNAFGREGLEHVYELAEVYHCENPDKLVAFFSERHGIAVGTYDNVAECMYRIPSPWDIGMVHSWLIMEIVRRQGRELFDVLIEVYNSWIAKAIDNYNSSMYYENTSYHYASYLLGHSA